MSLTKLETQSKLSINPIRNRNKYNIYPLTPTFVKHYLPSLYKNYTQTLQNFFITDNKTIDIRLREYQNKDIQIMLKRKVNGLFYEQRLGKTPTTISTIAHNPNIKKTLIIAPKSTHVNWENEIYVWHNPNVKVARIRGPLSQRKNYYLSADFSYYISTYETAAKDLELFPEFDCIVIDEIHRLRNFKGQRSNKSPTFTKKILQLSYKIPYKFALSGTPASNKSEDIFPILNFLYPNIFSSYWSFIEFYYVLSTEYTVTRNGWEPIQVVKDLKPDGKIYLQEFLDLTCIQRKRKDHMKWIPKVDKQLIKLEMTPKQKKYYNQLNTTWECEELGYDCPNILSLTTRLRQITNLEDGCKEEFVLSYIEDYPNEKIIISSFFSSCLEHLRLRITQKGIKTFIITGTTTAKDRQRIVDEFNNTNEPIILLGNVSVIKEGLKLEQAHTFIELDPSLTQADNQQVYDRFIPTTEEVAIKKEKQQIIKLIAKDTIDEYIFSCLKLKKTSAEIINNYKSNKVV